MLSHVNCILEIHSKDQGYAIVYHVHAILFCFASEADLYLQIGDEGR